NHGTLSMCASNHPACFIVSRRHPLSIFDPTPITAQSRALLPFVARNSAAVPVRRVFFIWAYSPCIACHSNKLRFRRRWRHPTLLLSLLDAVPLCPCAQSGGSMRNCSFGERLV